MFFTRISLGRNGFKLVANGRS